MMMFRTMCDIHSKSTIKALEQCQWRIQRLILAHREREARAWENQLGVCKPPAGTGQSPVGEREAKPPENFDDLLVKITFLKLNMPFYET